MDIFFSVIIIYIALISVIWLHEVGHSLIYTLYGCKKNPFHVTVRAYIFFSTPLPIDMGKEKRLTKKQHFIIGIGGIFINLVIGIPICLYILKTESFAINSYLSLYIYLFAIFHLVEAMTYMVINNLVVSSDIKAVHEYKPVLRVPIFIIGLISLKLIMDLYEVCPIQYKIIVGISIIIICSAMGGARIIFQLIQKNKISDKVSNGL